MARIKKNVAEIYPIFFSRRLVENSVPVAKISKTVYILEIVDKKNRNTIAYTLRP